MSCVCKRTCLWNWLICRLQWGPCAAAHGTMVAPPPFITSWSPRSLSVYCLQAANDIQLETSRSVIAQKNAEIRRAKQVLLTDAVEALQKKVKKGKGVSKELMRERNAKVKS